MIREGAHQARTEEEKEAVYRFRYEVYVAEMGRYQNVADHKRRRFREPEDDSARIFYRLFMFVAPGHLPALLEERGGHKLLRGKRIGSSKPGRLGTSFMGSPVTDSIVARVVLIQIA